MSMFYMFQSRLFELLRRTIWPDMTPCSFAKLFLRAPPEFRFEQILVVFEKYLPQMGR